MSARKVRDSKTIASPELFVTVEIHNQNSKNRQRHHRSSVLNELKNTENILNESLNKKNNESNVSKFSSIKRKNGS